MVSSFTLKTDELDNNFLATIKKLFAGKEIEIIIQDSQTDTDYLLKNPANKSHLLASISSLVIAPAPLIERPQNDGKQLLRITQSYKRYPLVSFVLAGIIESTP